MGEKRESVAKTLTTRAKREKDIDDIASLRKRIEKLEMAIKPVGGPPPDGPKYVSPFDINAEADENGVVS